MSGIRQHPGVTTTMFRLKLLFTFLAAFLTVTVFFSEARQVLAQSEKKPAEPQGPVKPTATTGGVGTSPLYKPPLRGAPSGRVGGGTRGGPGSERSVVLSVLTPDH